MALADASQAPVVMVGGHWQASHVSGFSSKKRQRGGPDLAGRAGVPGCATVAGRSLWDRQGGR